MFLTLKFPTTWELFLEAYEMSPLVGCIIGWDDDDNDDVDDDDDVDNDHDRPHS